MFFQSTPEIPSVVENGDHTTMNTAALGTIELTWAEKRDLLHLCEVGMKKHYMARSTVVNARFAKFFREGGFITVSLYHTDKNARISCNELYDYLS